MPSSPENARRYYDELVARGVCTMCRKQEACFGFTLCADCQEKKAEYYQQNQEKYKQMANERRARYKAEGLCVRCGKEKEDNGTLQCDVCRKMSSFAHKRWRFKYRGGN